MAGEKGAPRTTLDALRRRRARRCTSTRTRARATTAGSCSPAAARARCRAALVRDGPAAARARARPARRRVRARPRARWSCGTTATRSTATATTRSARVATAAGVDVVATNNVHYATPAQRPLATALAAIRAASLARRDRRLAPRRTVRAPAQRGGAGCGGSPRWPGAVERTRRDRAARARSTCASPRPSCPTTTCPTGHTDMTLAARAHRARRGRALPVDPPAARAGDAPDRVRARRDRAARLPRLLPRARRHRRVLPHATTSTARGGGARPTARSVTRSASPRPTRSRSACCSSGSSRSSATVRPTSTSTSSTSGARR